MRIQWLRVALRDVDGIEDWVAERNVLAAIDTLDAILAAVDRLASFPSIGRPGRVAGTRELPVTGTPFLVVYVVERDRVAIVRVLHGARRWPPDG